VESTTGTLSTGHCLSGLPFLQVISTGLVPSTPSFPLASSARFGRHSTSDAGSVTQ
jgi:hypothetical protein